MTIAELHHKHEKGEEDALTSDVFGCFKYLPPSLGLLPFLAKAEPFQRGGPPFRFDADEALYCFWPRAKRREPDLFILLVKNSKPKAALIVEAKYTASKHNLQNNADEDAEREQSPPLKRDSDEKEGDQLADYFRALLNNNIKLPERRSYSAGELQLRVDRRSSQTKTLLNKVPANSRYLLYVTAHYASPSADIDETLGCLGRGITSEQRRHLLWINWQAAARTLEALITNPLATMSHPQRELAMDTLALLEQKRLTHYRGWRDLVLLQEKLSAAPYFWLQAQRFLVGINSSDLRLQDSPYFFK
jgi:hypothetical protein